MIRKTKQIKLNIKDNLLVKFGTIDKNAPNVLFIRCKGKVIPTIVKSDYSNEIVELKIKYKNIVKNVINYYCDIFDSNKYLCNMDISEKGITYKKGSYIKFDVFLMPHIVKDINFYENIITELITKINNELINILNNLNLKYL